MSKDSGYVQFEDGGRKQTPYLSICLMVICIGLTGFSVFQYVQIVNLKNDMTELKIEAAVASFGVSKDVKVWV